MSRAKKQPAAAPPAPAPVPAPSSDLRAWRGALSAGAAALLALYLALPEKVFVFDGIMFSGVIERAISEWRGELLNRRHLLFNPLLMGLRDALVRLGATISGYSLIQGFNAVLGAAGVVVFLGLLRSLRLPRWTAAAGALLLGGCFAYAGRATEGQVYMTLALAQLCTVWACVSLLQEPSAGRALLLAAVFAAGCAFHAANVVTAPACAAAVLLARRRGGALVLWAAPAAAVLTVLPFAVAFKLSSWGDAVSFLGRATEMQMSGPASAAGLLGSALNYHVMAPGARAAAVLQQALDAFAANSLSQTAAAWLGLGVLVLFAAAAAPALADEKRRPAALVLAAAAASGVAFAAYWLGGEFFWPAPVGFMIALALLGARAPERLAAPVAGAAALLLGWNLYAGLVPRSKLENNEGYRRAMFVRDHTGPSSWIVISGLGFPNQKVYLGYFAHRSREVLEYYLDRFPKDEALRRFSAFARANEDNGVPMYLLPDLVDDKRALAELEKQWKVTIADLMRAFGPGRLVVMAQQDPGFRVYLFVPEDRPEPLFAVLSYNILTESDPQRLSETATALKEVAAGMTPARKAAAARLLEQSDYGGALLMKGFGPYMNPEGRAAAQARLARFAEYQKTADFHLRLGNLYKYLGRTDLVRREWTKAYEMTRDEGLGAQLRSLK